MSNQNKPNSAKEEQTKNALVPKLRFPEFRGEVLRCVQLGDVTEEARSRNGNKHSIASVMGVTKSEGIVPMEARLIAADIARYKLVEHDWFAYNPMRLNIGSIARWKGEHEILVSPDYVVFKCLTKSASSIAPAYLDHLRETKTWKEFVTEGGDGSVRVRIYYKDIARVGLALPSFHEQQKIADCLTSLDDLITAQARKVDALKTHKKGLMQQLFPRKGETQPRLRFPEFRESGEWEEKPLSSFCKVGDIDHKMPSSVAEGIPYVMTGDFFGINNIDFHNSKKISFDDYEKLSKKIKPERGDIVMARYASVGAVRHIETSIQFLVSYSCAIIKCERSENSKFLYYILQSEDIQSRIGAEINMSSQKNIGIDSIKKLKSFLPNPVEQKKIATCLTTLDTQITTEIQKLATLKTHKKGLMQQLFPSPEVFES